MMKYGLSLLLVTTLLSGPALAQDAAALAPAPTAEDKFAKMDLDHDGKVTDADIDAKKAEILAAHPDAKNVDQRNADIKAHFKVMDSNADGGVDLAEYKAYQDEWLAKADTDKDGVVSPQERDAVKQD